MVDKLTPERRSWTMSRIRGKDTAIEMKVRKYLFGCGFRYRKNVTELPGKPDLVLPKYKTVIFVHGCFWHQHEGCKYATVPDTRTEFWVEKFRKNIENDRLNQERLVAMGWKVLVIWECEVNHKFEETMKRILEELKVKQ